VNVAVVIPPALFAIYQTAARLNVAPAASVHPAGGVNAFADELYKHATSNVPAVDPAGSVTTAEPVPLTAGPVCTFANAT
jgi:hypothetical protein